MTEQAARQALALSRSIGAEDSDFARQARATLDTLAAKRRRDHRGE